MHSRATFDFAAWVYDNPLYFDNVERAWAVWVLSKMGFASKLDGTFGYDRQSNGICKKIAGAKELFTDELSIRLEKTQIECTSALKVISSRDCEGAFHFVDPLTLIQIAAIIQIPLTWQTLSHYLNCWFL